MCTPGALQADAHAIPKPTEFAASEVSGLKAGEEIDFAMDKSGGHATVIVARVRSDAGVQIVQLRGDRVDGRTRKGK